MMPRTSTAEGLEGTAAKVRDMLPETLVDLFEERARLSRDSFRRIEPAFPGRVAAVDGSHAILCDGGHFSIGAVRAAVSMFQGGSRSRLRATPVRIVMLGPDRENADFSEIYRELFHHAPVEPLPNKDPEWTCGILRETLEYAAMLLLARELSAGDILLVDGALRVSHAAHHAILGEIEETCAKNDVLLAAVTKKTSAAWGKGYPLLPAVGGLAERWAVDGAWYVKIPRDILDSTPYNEHYQNEIYVGKLSADAPRGFKVEFPAGYADDDDYAVRAFPALAAYAADARLPGYPYPLVDAHRTALIDIDCAEEIRQDLLYAVAERGMGYAQFHDLFGDYHDELARY
jgi:hypothetical protein